jgi:hypothetical protein
MVIRIVVRLSEQHDAPLRELREHAIVGDRTRLSLRRCGPLTGRDAAAGGARLQRERGERNTADAGERVHEWLLS